MPSYRYENKLYPLRDDLTFAECEWVERKAKTNLNEMTTSMKTRATVLLSLRRAGKLLTWEDSGDLSPANMVADEDGADDKPEVAEDPKA